MITPYAKFFCEKILSVWCRKTTIIRKAHFPVSQIFDFRNAFARPSDWPPCAQNSTTRPAESWLTRSSRLGQSARGAAASLKKIFAEKFFQRFYPLTMTRARRHFSAKIQPRELCAFHPNPIPASSRRMRAHWGEVRWLPLMGNPSLPSLLAYACFAPKSLVSVFSVSGGETDGGTQTKKNRPILGPKKTPFFGVSSLLDT